MASGRPVGFYVIMTFGILLFLVLVFGQMMSFIDYDFTVSVSLQEPESVVGGMGVAVNKAFGVGDTIIYLPILIAGIAGLCLKKVWGVFAMAGALAITAYWPVVCISMLFFAKGTPDFNFTRFVPYTVVLSLVSLYGVLGLWYVYTRRYILMHT